MRFLGHDGGRFSLEFATEEKALLLNVLSLYPLVPESYHKLTRDKKLPMLEENQQLLGDALEVQREQNKNEILTFISVPRRFTESEGVSQVSLARADLEWLLQVVNDVRVGCWIAMGSPDYETKKQGRMEKESLQHMMFMELAGAFQMFFLGIVNGDVPPEGKE